MRGSIASGRTSDYSNREVAGTSLTYCAVEYGPEQAAHTHLLLSPNRTIMRLVMLRSQEGNRTGRSGVALVMCHTPSKTQTNIRTKRQTTDTRNRIRCILALKCEIWWQYDFQTDNQLTKFHVFIG